MEDQNASRKRQKHTELWKVNKCKKLRNSGQCYISRKTKREVPARSIDQQCKCSRKCFEQIGMNVVQVIFSNFWGLSDYNLQNSYLLSLLKWDNCKVSKIVNRPSRKLRTISYFVKVNGEAVSVCRSAFISIHGITEKRVRVVLSKESVSGTVDSDTRGKSTPKNKISGERKMLVKQHIENLATVSSHYSRAKSPFRKYMPPGSSIKGAYNAYKEWLNENTPDEQPVTEDYYHRIFVNDYNIGIQPPAIDDCNICSKLKTEINELKKTDPESINLQRINQDLQIHLKKQQVAQDIMKSYENNTDNSVAVVAIDLQQALPTPKLTCNAQYYKRKMWTYNFAVHNIKTGASTMYVWDETVAKRGSCEIASFILHYFENYVDVDVKSVIVFSDNCPGQNKNLNVVLGYLRLIHNNKFETIRHYFLVPGHSMMGCDRDFGHIKIKTMHCEVFTKDHYIHFIKNTRKRNQFQVVRVTRDMIKDFNVLLESVSKKQLLNSKFKDGKIFEFSSDLRTGFKIQPFYNTDAPKFVQLQKGKSSRYNQDIFDLSATYLPTKYPAPIKLTEAKQKDLKDLLPYVPMPYKSVLEQAIRSDGIEVSEIENAHEDDIIDFDM